MNNKGTSIVFAVFTLIVLSIAGLVIFSLVSSDTGSAVSQVLSSRALFAGEAGWQIGAQAVKNDKNQAPQTVNPSANGYYAYVYLEGGYNTSYLGNNTMNPEKACFHGQAIDNSTPGYHKKNIAKNECILDTEPSAYISVWNFQQSINFLGTRITDMDMVLRAAKEPGGLEPVIQLEYSTDGGLVWTPLGSEITISNDADSDWSVYEFVNLGSAFGWQDLMDTSNFRIRARRLDGGGNRKCYIDWLALRITVEIDGLTEPWGSSSYIDLSASLGESSIESINVNDESGKVNINYAPQNLLRRLFEYCGLANANTIAASVVNYRGDNLTNPFNTIEEIKQVSGMTEADYDLINQDITVYSWVNQNVFLPSGSRAPININTASKNVLKAIFRTAFSNEGDITRLADDVYVQARSDPFTHLFSYYGNQQYFDGGANFTRCFSAFLESIGYLSRPQRDRLRNIADGSEFNKTLTENWDINDDAGGTEFCYYSHTFLIESKGKSGNIERTVLQTYGDTDYNYSTFGFDSTNVLALETFINESNPDPYWRERH